MVDIDKLLSDSLQNYFETLPLTGYMPQSDVNRLLTLAAINFIINEFPERITNEDWVAISKAISCIADGCLIDFPSNYSCDRLFQDIGRGLDFRVTETLRTTRSSQDGLFRIKM